MRHTTVEMIRKPGHSLPIDQLKEEQSYMVNMELDKEVTIMIHKRAPPATVH